MRDIDRERRERVCVLVYVFCVFVNRVLMANLQTGQRHLSYYSFKHMT